MTDYVGTCPKTFWEKWLAEGDAAGDQDTGYQWCWFVVRASTYQIIPGDRFYVVAHEKLRGWSLVTDVLPYGIVRKGNAVACTIDEAIPGFRGLRKRWWDREIEHPFPDWKMP